MKEKGGIPFIHILFTDQTMLKSVEEILTDLKAKVIVYASPFNPVDDLSNGGLFILDKPVPVNDFQKLQDKIKGPSFWIGYISAPSDEEGFRHIGISHLISSQHNKSVQISLFKSFFELAQKQMEIEFLEQEIDLRHIRYLEHDSKLKLLSSSVKEPIVFINQDHNITLWNKEAQRIFGYTKYEIRNEKFLRWIVAERSSQEVAKLFEIADSGEMNKSTSVILLYVKNKLGVEFETKASISIQRNKKGYNLVFVFHDIQKDKKLDREILRNRELWDETKILKEFIHNVTHELRTPMNSIIGIAKALQKYNADNLHDRQLEGLQIILNSGNQLIDLIKDLLDIARMDKNKIELNYEYFNIDKFLSHQKSQALNLIEDRPIRLNIKKSPSVPPILYADHRKIFQVLTNLVGNAVKFTKEGKINISCHYLDNTLFFEVTDTGIGIRPEKKKEIFQKFSQADSAFSSIGTGLGLHISKKLVKLMAGEISLESEFEKGTVVKFKIKLPEQPKDSEESINMLKKEALRIFRYIPGRKLLLAIDDNNQNQFIYKLFSEKKSYNLILAKNGKTGLHAVKALKPDLVIVRLEVPEIHGTSIIKSISKFVSCVAVSSYDKTTSIKETPLKILFEPIGLENLEQRVSEIEVPPKWENTENTVICAANSLLKNKYYNVKDYFFLQNPDVEFSFVQVCQLKSRNIVFEDAEPKNCRLLLEKLLDHTNYIKSTQIILLSDQKQPNGLYELISKHENIEIISKEEFSFRINGKTT